MLYHISSIHNLNILEPKVSTHGKAYVYAVDNIVTGLLFGTKKDDFDFILRTDEKGRPEIYECYKNAFKQIYTGTSCSIYEVEESGFLSGKTGWNSEYVSENKVEVLNEIVVEDLYNKLCDEEKKENLIVHRFKDSEQYKRMISNHIVDRLVRFNILDKPVIEERLRTYYGDIIDALNEIMSGKYL